ncbi:7356_t:CDS:2 [Dentiscutata erythropus]|uniref:7356_t:CDS:1 n=1 Tax=Dentiscutata erythropus TaxID=1348616 RepID=A0A9N9IBC7_9GLOM|nr:7356_t:CDS:2 [Dentiscutata erythropus]
MIERIACSELSYPTNWSFAKDVILSTHTIKYPKLVVLLTDILRSVTTNLNYHPLKEPLIELEPEVIKLDSKKTSDFKGYYVYFRHIKNEYLTDVAKYIMFSHTVIQVQEQYYKLVPKKDKWIVFRHWTLLLEGFSSCIHIEPTYYMTGKILPYKYISGYNLMLMPKERSLKTYLDFYFKPEYSTINQDSIQVEELIKQINLLYQSVSFTIPTLKTTKKYTSNIYDLFTDYNFIFNAQKEPINQLRNQRKIVWFALINLVKHQFALITGKTIYKLIDRKLNIPDDKELILDLNQIEEFYSKHFNIPVDLGIKKIKNELYKIGITLPVRKFEKEIDLITADMLKKLQVKYPHPEDIEKNKEKKICEAVFNQLYHLLGESKFMSPEEVLSK